MSAYVVSPVTIDFLVESALNLNRDFANLRYAGELVTGDNAQKVARALMAQNIASVGYRYPDCSLDDLPGIIPTPVPGAHRFELRRVPFNPLSVLSAINNFEYQSCECPSWDTSAALRFCQDMRDSAVYRLPGYDEATFPM